MRKLKHDISKYERKRARYYFNTHKKSDEERDGGYQGLIHRVNPYIYYRNQDFVSEDSGYIGMNSNGYILPRYANENTIYTHYHKPKTHKRQNDIHNHMRYATEYRFEDQHGKSDRRLRNRVRKFANDRNRANERPNMGNDLRQKKYHQEPYSPHRSQVHKSEEHAIPTIRRAHNKGESKYEGEYGETWIHTRRHRSYRHRWRHSRSRTHMNHKESSDFKEEFWLSMMQWRSDQKAKGRWSSHIEREFWQRMMCWRSDDEIHETKGMTKSESDVDFVNIDYDSPSQEYKPKVMSNSVPPLKLIAEGMF